MLSALYTAASQARVVTAYHTFNWERTIGRSLSSPSACLNYNQKSTPGAYTDFAAGKGWAGEAGCPTRYFWPKRQIEISGLSAREADGDLPRVFRKSSPVKPMGHPFFIFGLLWGIRTFTACQYGNNLTENGEKGYSTRVVLKRSALWHGSE